MKAKVNNRVVEDELQASTMNPEETSHREKAGERERDESVVKERWNAIYEGGKYVPSTIDESMPRIAELFEKSKVKRVLDLGCGGGRHSAYLAERGFDVYGIDIADAGVKKAEETLREKGLHAHLSVGSISELPYDDNFFDGVISIRVLHHGRIDAVRKHIREIERVVKPGGIIFVTVRKRVPKKQRRPFKEVAPHTYVPVEGGEIGIAHYLFTKELLRKEFRNVRIIDLWVDASNYYCLLAQKRHG